MTKRELKKSKGLHEDHDELIERLTKSGDYDDLIQFMEDLKPRRPLTGGDEKDQFEKAVYRMIVSAWKLRKKDRSEFRRTVGQLSRDVGVFLVEME